MKKIIALLAVTLMSASCINLEGRLNVSKELTVNKRSGFLFLSRKKMVIQPGSYDAKLKMNSENSLTLKVDVDGEGMKEVLIPIKRDEKIYFPDNGSLVVRGQDIDQPFDLSGRVETRVTNSDVVGDRENCPVTREEKRCEQVCTPPAPNRAPVCDLNCKQVIVTITGSRAVEYHTRYVSKGLRADLLDSETKEILASFDGTDSDSEKVYDFIGECRLR